MSAGVSSLRSSSSEPPDLALGAKVSVAVQPTELVPSGADGYFYSGMNGFLNLRGI